MKRSKSRGRPFLVAGVIVSLGLAGLVVAQSGGKDEKEKAPGMMSGTEKEMKKGGMDSETMMNHRMEMMKQSGASEMDMKQWKARMMVKVHADSPAGLLAMKDALALTEDQVRQLEAAESEAVEKARAVLSDKQKTDFEKLKYAPASIWDMSQQAGRSAMGMMKEGMEGSEMKHEGMMEGAGMKEGSTKREGKEMK